MATAREPPLKKQKIDYTDEFKVAVGTGHKQKIFPVAKDVLVKSSEYFRAACSKEWNGEAKIVTLADGRPDIFAVYVQFLHTGQIVVWDNGPPSVTPAPEDPGFDATMVSGLDGLRDLVRLYVLAEMLLDLPAKNAVVDYLLALKVIPLLALSVMRPAVEAVYKGTMVGSPLRRLLVDVACADAEFSKERLAAFMPEYLIDITFHLLESRKQSRQVVRPHDAPKCFYHEHNDEFPKCS